MIRCPNCESYDVHRSRTRRGLEALPALVGLRPRRCSACGWRGLRFGKGAGASSRAAPSAQEQAARLARETEASRGRRRRARARLVPRPAARQRRALLLAIFLGAAIGVAAQTCAGGDTVATE